MNFVARNNIIVNGVPVIPPPLSANLDQASVSPAGSNTAITNQALFTGASTPGAAITYINNINGQPTTTTADNLGHYSIIVQLLTGTNAFTVLSNNGLGLITVIQSPSVTFSPP